MKKLKLLYAFIATLLIGSAVAFFRLGDLGTDPFTTFNLGFSASLNITFGTFIVISNLLALVFIYFTDRKLIGIGTFLNIFIVGYFSDFVIYMYTNLFGTPESLVLQILFSLIGVLLISMGAALYIESKAGVGPYDALPLVVETLSKGKMSFRLSRVILDVSATLIGYFLGATIGVITIFTAFFLGPFIQFFREVYQDKLNTDELEHSIK